MQLDYELEISKRLIVYEHTAKQIAAFALLNSTSKSTVMQTGDTKWRKEYC